MNKENKKTVQDLVAVLGKSLEGKLPPYEGLPTRNPYAHLWKTIKDHYGMSYADVPDDRFGEVIQLLKDETARSLQ